MANIVRTMIILLYTISLMVLGKGPEVELFLGEKPGPGLTHLEKETLNRFKNIMTLQLDQDYMKKDNFLLGFLRAKNFDVPSATQMLKKNLEWRRVYKMDTIQQEDWSEFERNYPYRTNTVDKHGRPIFFMNFGSDWDVAKATREGKLDRLIRWLILGREETIIKARENNVTQWDIVFNFDNFGLTKHLCVQCLRLYSEFTSTYEANYPGSVYKVYLVNVPWIFDQVLKVIRPLMLPATLESLKIHGNNRKDWQPVLLEEIDRKQLPLLDFDQENESPIFGGHLGLGILPNLPNLG